jgi:hypothetical protein
LVIVFYLHLPATERARVLAHAQDALASGGTLLVVGHDLSNLTHGYGGPQDPTVLFTPQEVAVDLERLRIVRADHVDRRVDTDQGSKVAIDALVRALKSAS